MSEPEPKTHLPECLDCGACCHSINPRLVELLGADAHTVPEEFAEGDSSGGAHMRMLKDPACGGFVCSALGEKNACRIYERRPFLCREFERGSAECLAAIADRRKPLDQRRH